MIRWLLFFLLLVPTSLHAQATHLVPRLLAEGPAPQGGGKVEMAIVFETEPGWHGYWLNPGDAGLPLSVEWAVPEGVKIGALRYPTPEMFEGAGLVNYVYKGEHAVLFEAAIPASNRTEMRFAGTLRWLACTDKVCVPEKGEIALVLPVGDGASRTAEFDGYRRKLPRLLDSAGGFAADARDLTLWVPVPASLDTGTPQLFIANPDLVEPAAPQHPRRVGDAILFDLKLKPGAAVPETIDAVVRLENGQGLEVIAEPGRVPGGKATALDRETMGVLAAVLGAILGGVFLNMMPCVFPILGMKALHLARAGGEEDEARADALGYTAGAVLGTAALGALLLALRAGGAAAGWAFQLQDPRIVFLLTMLAGAITANLLGLFRLPVLAGSVRASGSVSTGALAALVATPCSGPFLGAALGAALVLPWWGGLAVFAGLGLGIALPFLAIGFLPFLRKRLPAPGPWMVRMQRWLAIPMGATLAGGLYLLWRMTGTNGLLVALGALALLLVLLVASKRSVALGWAALAGGLLLAVGGAALMPEPGGQERGVPDYAQVWSEEAVAAALAEGRPVFVDFTADWCLSCKVNEQVALDRDDTLAAFEAANVAVFVADWTDGDPAITRFLESRGRAGVPLYLWYAPGSATPEELPQILTPAMLIERVQSAE